MKILPIFFWLSVSLVAYVYIGYPLILLAMRRLGERKPVVSGELQPDVTLIISAFNEADVIEEKIRNSLDMEYPKERLEVVVVSDASDDETDDIVKKFEECGVRLLRMRERSGKTLGLNAAVAEARGELLVFSDANAMYKRDAIKALVRNFADESIVPYNRLISTLPLDKMMEMTGLNVEAQPDPYSSVLVLNIGAVRGDRCPDAHWLYNPDSKAGFHRVGFYSNVDISFLPRLKQTQQSHVGIYVERAFDGGQKPHKKDIELYIDAVIEPTDTRRMLIHALDISSNKQENPPKKKHGVPPF